MLSTHCSQLWVGTMLTLLTSPLRPVKAAEDPATTPNIVLLLADDLGYGDLGCYGNENGVTPNIDRLAQDGMKFSRMYSEVGDASSRAAILTGRYPVRYGMLREAQALPFLRKPDFHSVAQPGGLHGLDAPLLPSTLKKQGYQQALIGKWNLGVGEEREHLPMGLEFDVFYGTPLSHGPACTKNEEVKFTDGDILLAFFKRMLPVMIALVVMQYLNLMRAPLATFLFCLNILAFVSYGSYVSFTDFNEKSCILMRNDVILEQPYKEDNMTLRFTKQALEFVSTSASNSQPFFLFMSYLQPHHPPIVSPRFRNRSGRGVYHDSVMELDWSVGAIVKQLKDLNIYSNTLIIFASDNGPEITDPRTKKPYADGLRGSLRFHTGHSYDVVELKGEKQTALEGGIRVPAIITWPKVIEPRQTSKNVASFIDLLPTIQDILLLNEAGLNVDGISLLPRLKSSQAPVTRRTLMHYCDTDGVSAVTANRYKAHFHDCSGNKFDPPLLFDMERDPEESSPLKPSDHEKVIADVKAAVSLHKSSVLAYPAQFSQLLRPWMYLCGSFPLCVTEMEQTENFEDLFS